MDSEVKRKIESDGIRNALLNTIPDGMTNGDVIKILFPNIKWWVNSDNEVFTINKYDKWIYLDLDWWNATYKKGE